MMTDKECSIIIILQDRGWEQYHSTSYDMAFFAKGNRTVVLNTWQPYSKGCRVINEHVDIILEKNPLDWRHLKQLYPKRKQL